MSVYIHPVLRSDTDDIKGTCNIEINFSEEGVLSIKPEIVNKEINKLIESNQASVKLSLENKSAFFRKFVDADINGTNIELDPNNDPSGKYNVYVSVRTNQDETEYKLNSFHNDYDGAEFTLNKGAIIAYLGNFSFTYKKDFQKDKERDSIFQLDPNDKHEMGAFRIDYLGDSIIIQMHTNDHNKLYKTLNAISKSVLLNVYVMPALIDAIWNYDEEEHEGRHWADTISDIIEDKGLDPDDPVFTAQRILADPVNAITKSLVELTASESDEN